MTKISDSKKIMIFGMKNQMLEASLTKLENDGIELGHKSTLKLQERVDSELFELEIRKSAKMMADFYVIYYCLENSIRKMIHDVLLEKYGSNWWNDKIPETIRKDAASKQTEEINYGIDVKNIDDLLGYTFFGDLITIIESNWVDFSSYIRDKISMRHKLSQISKSRNIIAHSRELTKDEVVRLELLVHDWQRILT